MALSAKKREFAENFVRTGKAAQAARDAGYKEGAALYASQWLNPKNTKKFDAELAAYIAERIEMLDEELIAKANEVLRFYTQVMRGEISDQFGLEASLDTRLKAADALMKRYGPARNEEAAQREDDGLAQALREEAKRIRRGADDSAMLPEEEDGDEEGG